MRGKRDQWNRTESSEILPHKYGQLIFDKGTKAIHWSKNNLKGHPHEKSESKQRLYVLYKKYLKMDHRPTYEMRNYESPKDNIGENLGDIGRGDEFLDTTPGHSTGRG